MENAGKIYVGLGFIICLYGYYLTLNRRRWWVRPINAERESKGAFANIFKYAKHNDQETFFRYTRMAPQQFDKLLMLLKRQLRKRSYRQALSPELRLAMTLKYLAHGGSFWSLCWEFRVGHSTAAEVVAETCHIIWNVLSPIYLNTPVSPNEWLNVSDLFERRWHFPHTLGAIDGKHVQLQCPIISGSLFFNYKQHFSLVLLATSDADYKFLWVDIGAYGSESDGGIFRRSVMGQMLNGGSLALPASQMLPGSNIKMPYYFLGDEGFPLKSFLMRPYPGKYLEKKKRIFNYRLSRARRIIENCFGILASRWRIFRQPILCSVTGTEALVKAAVCLHNFLRTEDCPLYCPPNLVDRVAEDGEIIEGEWRSITRNDSNLTRLGRVGSNMAIRELYSLRDQLADYLISPAGRVSRQEGYVNYR